MIEIHFTTLQYPNVRKEQVDTTIDLTSGSF